MSPTGKMPYGEVAKVIKGMKKYNPWLDRKVVNFALKKLRANKKKVDMLEDDEKTADNSRTECLSPSETQKLSMICTK